MKGGGGGGGRISVVCTGVGSVHNASTPRFRAYGGRGFDPDEAELRFGAQRRLDHGGGAGGSAGTIYRHCPNNGADWTDYLLLDNNHHAATHPTFIVEKDIVELEFKTVQLVNGGEFAVSPEGIANTTTFTTRIKRLIGDKTGRLHVIRNSNIVVSGNNLTSTRVGQSTFSDETTSDAWRTATTRTYYQNDLLNAEYHMKVYQGGNLVLPGRVALSGVYLDLRGNLTGVDHLVIANKSTVDFEATSTSSLRGTPPFGDWDETHACAVVPGGTNSNCAAANADASTCFAAGAVSTCSVLSGGTNGDCAVANADASTCLAASEAHTCIVASGGTNDDCAAANANASSCIAASEAHTCTVALGGTNDNCTTANADASSCLAASEAHTCSVASGGTNDNCAAAKANASVCVGASVGTCSVTTDGFNGDCASQTTMATCAAATVSGGSGDDANDCVFSATVANACEFVDKSANACEFTDRSCEFDDRSSNACEFQRNSSCVFTDNSFDTNSALGELNVFAFRSFVVEDNSRVRFREGSRLYAWNMTVGSRSFEHPFNGTTRRRLDGLVDIEASYNYVQCSEGSTCGFTRQVRRGDRLWVDNHEFTVHDANKFGKEEAADTTFHPRKITLGTKDDPRRIATPLFTQAVRRVPVYTTYETVIETHHTSTWRVQTLTLTNEGRITGTSLGFGNRESPPALCPFKSRNIICRDDNDAKGVEVPATVQYKNGMSDWEIAGSGTYHWDAPLSHGPEIEAIDVHCPSLANLSRQVFALAEGEAKHEAMWGLTPKLKACMGGTVRPRVDRATRLGYGGSHGGVGGYTFMLRGKDNESKILGGGVPDLESYGGEVGRIGYGAYNWPRTMGSTGSAGYHHMHFGGPGGAAFELRAHNVILDGKIEMDGTRGADDTNSGTKTAAGGGAGGSILIVADGDMSGSGSLSAMGGAGGHASVKGAGGGGGGGRIALHYGTRSDGGNINMTVAGGNSDAMGPAGGAGTLYLRNIATEATQLIVDNEGLEQIPEWMGVLTEQGKIHVGVATYLDDGNAASVFVQLSSLRIVGKAIVVFSPRLATDYPRPMTIDVGQIFGDKTGRVKVLNNQTVVFRENVVDPLEYSSYTQTRTLLGANELEVISSSVRTLGASLSLLVSVTVDTYGALALPNTAEISGEGVQVDLQGAFVQTLKNLRVVRKAVLNLGPNAQTIGAGPGNLKLDSLEASEGGNITTVGPSVTVILSDKFKIGGPPSTPTSTIKVRGAFYVRTRTFEMTSSGFVDGRGLGYGAAPWQNNQFFGDDWTNSSSPPTENGGGGDVFIMQAQRGQPPTGKGWTKPFFCSRRNRNYDLANDLKDRCPWQYWSYPTLRDHKHWDSHPSWAYQEAGGVGGTYGGAGAGASGIMSEYGDYAYPLHPGSGGGGCTAIDDNNEHPSIMERRCAGGAAFTVNATGNIVIDGLIDVRGGSADNIGLWGAGGSGGGVLLNTEANFTGFGRILANGAKGKDREYLGGSAEHADYWGGAGGGGRVSIHCELKPLPTSIVLGYELLGDVSSGTMTPWDETNVSCSPVSTTYSRVLLKRISCQGKCLDVRINATCGDDGNYTSVVVSDGGKDVHSGDQFELPGSLIGGAFPGVGFDFTVRPMNLALDAPVYKGTIEAYGGEQEWSGEYQKGAGGTVYQNCAFIEDLLVASVSSTAGGRINKFGVEVDLAGRHRPPCKAICDACCGGRLDECACAGYKKVVVGWDGDRDYLNASLSFYKADDAGGDSDDVSYDAIQVQHGVVYLQPTTGELRGLLDTTTADDNTYTHMIDEIEIKSHSGLDMPPTFYIRTKFHMKGEGRGGATLIVEPLSLNLSVDNLERLDDCGSNSTDGCVPEQIKSKAYFYSSARWFTRQTHDLPEFWPAGFGQPAHLAARNNVFMFDTLIVKPGAELWFFDGAKIYARNNITVGSGEWGATTDYTAYLYLVGRTRIETSAMTVWANGVVDGSGYGHRADDTSTTSIDTGIEHTEPNLGGGPGEPEVLKGGGASHGGQGVMARDAAAASYCQVVKTGDHRRNDSDHVVYTTFDSCVSSPGHMWKVYQRGVMGGTGGYGDYKQPVTMGSRGGTWWNSHASGKGGAGGASIQIRTFEYLHVDGTIKVNGLEGTGHASEWSAGGGAGGSILVNTSVLKGYGAFEANGGNGGMGGNSNKRHGGGGGGGRIAVHCPLDPNADARDTGDADNSTAQNSWQFTGMFQTFGGKRTNNMTLTPRKRDEQTVYEVDWRGIDRIYRRDVGGAGTIYHDCGPYTDTLIVDNNNRPQADTTQIAQSKANITVRNVHVLARGQLSFVPVGFGNGTKNIIDIGVLHQDGTGFIWLRRDDVLVLRTNGSVSGLYETIVETKKVSETTLAVSASSIQYIGAETSIRTNLRMDEGSSLGASHNLIVSGVTVEIRGKVLGSRNLFITNGTRMAVFGTAYTDGMPEGTFDMSILRVEDGSIFRLENLTRLEVGNLTIGPVNKNNLAKLSVRGQLEMVVGVLNLGIYGVIDGVGGGWTHNIAEVQVGNQAEEDICREACIWIGGHHYEWGGSALQTCTCSDYGGPGQGEPVTSYKDWDQYDMTCSSNGECSGGGSYGGPGQGQGGTEIGEHEYKTPTYRGSAGSLGEQVDLHGSSYSFDGQDQPSITKSCSSTCNFDNVNFATGYSSRYRNYHPGGAGGAAVKLVCSEECLIEGEIDFSGAKSVPRGSHTNISGGGGGAGGSVWIVTPVLRGNGTISANGANGQEVMGGGAGGGGRIALDLWSHAFSGQLTAYGGIGAENPQNGCSVYSEHLKMFEAKPKEFCHHKGRTRNVGYGAAGTVYSEHLKDNVTLAMVAAGGGTRRRELGGFVQRQREPLGWHGQHTRRRLVGNYSAAWRTHYLIASVSKMYGGLVRKANVGFVMRRKNSNSAFPDLKEVTVYDGGLLNLIEPEESQKKAAASAYYENMLVSNGEVYLQLATNIVTAQMQLRKSTDAGETEIYYTATTLIVNEGGLVTFEPILRVKNMRWNIHGNIYGVKDLVLTGSGAEYAEVMFTNTSTMAPDDSADVNTFVFRNLEVKQGASVTFPWNSRLIVEGTLTLGDAAAGFQSNLFGTIVDLNVDDTGFFTVSKNSDAECQFHCVNGYCRHDIIKNDSTTTYDTVETCNAADGYTWQSFGGHFHEWAGVDNGKACTCRRQSRIYVNFRVEIHSGRFAIKRTGMIDGRGRGHARKLGPGAAAASCTQCGGSHGGRGGLQAGTPGTAGGNGEFRWPVEAGSGGGGGAGGASLFVNVTKDDAMVNGTIDMSGDTAIFVKPGFTASTGGGAGGSVIISTEMTSAGRIFGTGRILARGGDGIDYSSLNEAQGGGGGRIALRANGTGAHDISLEACGGAYSRTDYSSEANMGSYTGKFTEGMWWRANADRRRPLPRNFNWGRKDCRNATGASMTSYITERACLRATLGTICNSLTQTSYAGEIECLRAHHKAGDWPKWVQYGAAAATGTVFQMAGLGSFEELRIDGCGRKQIMSTKIVEGVSYHKLQRLQIVADGKVVVEPWNRTTVTVDAGILDGDTSGELHVLAAQTFMLRAQPGFSADYGVTTVVEPISDTQFSVTTRATRYVGGKIFLKVNLVLDEGSSLTTPSIVSMSGGTTAVLAGTITTVDTFIVGNGSTVTFLPTAIFGSPPGVANKLEVERLVLSTGATLICPDDFHINVSSAEIGLRGATSRIKGSANITLQALMLELGPSSRVDSVGQGMQPGTHFSLNSVGDRIGGSHGGPGQCAAASKEYGDYRYPSNVGSSGGDVNNGARGGGAVRIIANTLKLQGVVDASGATTEDIIDSNGGGGAGGSIWISAESCTGKNGSLIADGGIGALPYDSAVRGGGGAGGRIALHCQSGLPFAGLTKRVSANGAQGHTNWNNGGKCTAALVEHFGSAGTVFAQFPTVNEAGLWESNYLISSVSLEKGGMTRRANTKFFVSSSLNGNKKTVQVLSGGEFSLKHLHPDLYRAFGVGSLGQNNVASELESLLVTEMVGEQGFTHVREADKGTIEVSDVNVTGDGSGTSRVAFYDLHTLTVDTGATVYAEAKMFLGVSNCPDQACLTFTLRGDMVGVQELHIGKGATFVLGKKASIGSELRPNVFQLHNLFVNGGALVTLPYDATVKVHRMMRIGEHDWTKPVTTIQISFNATLEAGAIELLKTARIDGEGRGYGLDMGEHALPDMLTDVAYAPATHLINSSNSYEGGTHAGRGSWTKASSDAPNLVSTARSYGMFDFPTTSGCMGMGSNAHGSAGSPGGAAVRFTALERKGQDGNAVDWDSGIITINGTVDMDGAQASHAHSGGGAGGSALFEAKTLVGSGTVTAEGGDHYGTDSSAATGGGGGGGRVAFHCVTSNQLEEPYAAGLGDARRISKTLHTLSVLGGKGGPACRSGCTGSATDSVYGGPGTVYESWYRSRASIGVEESTFNRLTVDHEDRSRVNSPSTHVFHSSGNYLIHTVRLDRAAALEVVSHDFSGEALATMRFNNLTGDSTGTFEIGKYTTAVPLVPSPWAVLGSVKVKQFGTLRFETGMDMQLIGNAALEVAGTFVAKDGYAPAITTMNGTCDFLAGSLCQTESMALCSSPAYLSQNSGAGQRCEALSECAKPLFKEANSDPGEMCTLPVAFNPPWTHVFKSINVSGGRVTLPGDSRVLLDGDVTVTMRGTIRVESDFHMDGNSLTCGSPDSLMQSTIEWFGVGHLVMSEPVTFNVPCLVDGTGRGHEIKVGNGSATSNQQGGTHAGFGGGLDWDSGSIGGTRGYGNFLRPLTMGSGGGGARGGAAIYIKAPRVIVEGVIRMNGGDAERTAGLATHGGGAGGSIWVELTASDTCQGYVARGDDYVLTSMAGRITGNGTLSVVGGGGYHGGGGGRISIMQGYDLSKYDTDSSGAVSLGELQDALRARFTGVWSPEDGSIDAQINAKIFLEFDSDGSGSLDLDEFANFYEEYERIEFPGQTLAHGGDAWANFWADGVTYKTGTCQNTGGVVVPADGAPWTQCANIAGATWFVGAGHGWNGGAGTVVYTRLAFENRLGISFTRMASLPSTVVVDNYGRWNAWTTVIFDSFAVILDVNRFYIEGGAQATFGTRNIIVTDMKVTVNNFLGGSYPWSRIFIPINIELTITGADASMPEMQQYTTTTPMTGAFEDTRAEVTLTRVYYLADLGMSGFDFDTAEDSDSGAITLPERLNVMNCRFSLRRACKSGPQVSQRRVARVHHLLQHGEHGRSRSQHVCVPNPVGLGRRRAHVLRPR